MTVGRPLVIWAASFLALDMFKHLYERSAAKPGVAKCLMGAVSDRQYLDLTKSCTCGFLPYSDSDDSFEARIKKERLVKLKLKAANRLHLFEFFRAKGICHTQAASDPPHLGETHERQALVIHHFFSRGVPTFVSATSGQ